MLLRDEVGGEHILQRMAAYIYYQRMAAYIYCQRMAAYIYYQDVSKFIFTVNFSRHFWRARSLLVKLFLAGHVSEKNPTYSPPSIQALGNVLWTPSSKYMTARYL